MGTPKNLNDPRHYAEALVRASLDPNPTRLAAWFADDPEAAAGPYGKWYLYFAQKLIDQAPQPRLGFRFRPRFNPAPPKIGRNDPCPCGSGKKHKACHLGQDEDPAWKLGSPTPAVRSMAISLLIQGMPVDQLARVPREEAPPLAMVEIAANFYRSGLHADAIIILKEALDRERDDTFLLYDYWVARYAEWLVEADLPKEAEEFLLDEYDAQRAVHPFQVAQKLAAFYIDQGDPDNAQTWVETALEGDPENPFNHYLNGLLHHTLGHWDEAVTAYERSRALSDRFGEQERAYMLKLVEESLERASQHLPPEESDEAENDEAENDEAENDEAESDEVENDEAETTADEDDALVPVASADPAP